MIVGERISDLMSKHGLSQAELARRVGVSQPTIFSLIHHNKKGSAYLHRIARELNTTAAYLSGETDDPFSELSDYDAVSSEEREWIYLLRNLQPKDRMAALQLVRTIAHSAHSPNLQSVRHDFKGR